MPDARSALACSTMTLESTVFERLFHDDQPIGGRAIGLCLSGVLIGPSPTATAVDDNSNWGIARHCWVNRNKGLSATAISKTTTTFRFNVSFSRFTSEFRCHLSPSDQPR